MKGDHLLLSSRSREICFAAVMTALTVVAATFFVRVPAFGTGLRFHFGEAVLCTAALLGGGRLGAAVGGVGSALADIVLGLLVWAPVSLVVHGLEGYVIGRLSDGRGGARDFAALFYGAGLMMSGYAGGAWVLYGRAAVPVETAQNLVQAMVGITAAWAVSSAIRRAFPALLLRGREHGR
ncbi:MAG: ECF transporter S component [Firmicutes bacterium]|nr:ECF transporter S component [Bacillota bacterium]